MYLCSPSVNVPHPISAETSQKLTLMGLISALLVVSIHQKFYPGDSTTLSWWCAQFIQGNIARIAVPFFFLCSGYLLAGSTRQQHWYRQVVSKRCYTLLVPFFIWTMAWVILTILETLHANYSTGNEWYRNLTGVGRWIELLGFNPYGYPGLVPLWFIRSLFIFIVLSPCFISIKTKQVYRILLVALFMIYGLISPPLPIGGGGTVVESSFCALLRYTFSLEGLFYFACGIYLRFWPIHFSPSKRLRWCLFFLWILCSGLAIGCRTTTVNGQMVASLFTLIGIPLGLLACFSSLPVVTLPSCLKGFAFPLYLLHMFLLNIIFLIIVKFISIKTLLEPQNFMLKGIVLILMYCLAIIGSFFMYRLLRKLPFSSMLFGGRG